MLRILHSLPRTHKLLLLPVATMVTVLGGQTLFTAYQDHGQSRNPTNTTSLPLDGSASTDRAALPQPAHEESESGAESGSETAIATAFEQTSRVLDATRQSIPLSELKASDVIDLDVIESAAASPGHASATLPSKRLAGQTPTRMDDSARHIAVVVGTLGSGMLAAEANRNADAGNSSASNNRSVSNNSAAPVPDATSYEDYGIDRFDEVSFLPLEIAARSTYVPRWKTHIVNTGETFAAMAQDELGLGYSEALGLLDTLPDADLLTHWRAGQSFDYKLDKDGKLLSLKMMRNTREGVRVNRQDGDYTADAIERQGEPVQRLYAGSINGSFARSAEATGLGSSAVTELTQLLKKKFDFRRDSRNGDNFQVLVESDMIDDETLDTRVLAVKYQGQRMDLTLVRNAMNDTFYTPDGHSLDPAFARHPFDGNYTISSRFNPNRRHPTTGKISPHNGTDFAMPVGTPVNAPAGGRVERVIKHYAAGRYVVIRHDNGYRTRYLHLSKALVSKGDRVEMGDRIALSGNTGRSTGPHLHYEVHVNNAPVNAMTVDLPENTRLRGDSLVAFQHQAEPMITALESGDTGTINVASYSHSGGDSDAGSDGS